MTRGAWVAPAGHPDSQLRMALARNRLEKTGTITPDVLKFRVRRLQHTAQPRNTRSFVEASTNAPKKRRRIR